jgi:hypothetical protein
MAAFYLWQAVAAADRSAQRAQICTQMSHSADGSAKTAKMAFWAAQYYL